MASVAEFIVSKLMSQGVRAIFGVPGGGGNLDLIDAAGRAGLPFVLTTTETGGAIAAIAQFEVTGQPGACLTTLGPGAASVINGVACAHLERARIYVFTDSHASSDADRYEHQAIVQKAFFEPITRMSVSLKPGRAHKELPHVFQTTGELWPGPTHIDCPADFNGTPYPGEVDLPVGYKAPFGFQGDRQRFDSLLREARRPVAIVGLRARSPKAAAAIRHFCAERRVPAMVTYKAKGIVADGDEWFAGVFTNGAIERPVLEEADLLIGIGLDPVELLPRPWKWTAPIVYWGPPMNLGNHVPFIAAEFFPTEMGLERTSQAITPSSWDSSRLRELVADQRRAIDVRAEGMTAQQVVSVVAARCASTCRVTVDAGAHMFPATMLWPVSEPGGMLISNGLSTMGFALPAAIGAALIDRPRPVVALTGDGGLLMCVGELLTAVRERLRIIVVVFQDASLSLIEIKQQARALAPAGVALGAVDWRTLAAGFGVPAFSATDERGLARAVEQAMEVDGPSLIDAKIDRSNYGATLRAIRG